MSQRRDERNTWAGKSSGLTERLARTSALHPWRTIGLWAVLIVLAVLAVGSLLGSGLTSEMKFRAAKPDSLVGQELLQQRLTGPQKVTDFVIVRSATLTVDDPAFEAYVTDVAAKIQALGPNVVADVATFYQTNDPTAVSKDEHSTLIPVVMAGKMDDALKNVDKLHETVVAAQGQGFTVAQTGDASINEMFTKLAEKDLQRGEIFGIPAALIVLLVVFGAVLAAFMPLVMSVISIVLALALTALIGQVYPMNTFVLNILTMMGLAVGIDYTLFVISRYREERGRGLEKIDAIAATGATANRAIFFSGMTVVLAMSGMVIIPLDIMISMGVGVMLVVVTTLLTALILLPALLSLLGDRINALRVPFVGKLALKRANGSGGLWERLAHSIMRRPLPWLTVAVVALLVVAAPVVVMKKGNNTASAAHLPASEYAKQGWDILDRDFSLGKANPLMIVVDGQAASPDVEQAIDRLQTAMKADGRFGPAQVTANETGDLTLLTTTLAGDPAGEATQSLVKHLRSDIVPAAVDGTSAKIYVTGNTAGVVDYLGFFDTWLPIALAVVLSLSFVLLLVAFRSIVIPAQAIAMNLLSASAPPTACMVLVFQKGVGAGLLGLTQVDTHRGLGAALPLQPALRALDGLPGLPAQPHQGALRPDGRHPRGGRLRPGPHREHHHRRRRHHGLRVRRHGHRRAGHVPADGLRPRGRGPDRRHRGAQHHRAGLDGTARRAQLVPAALARVAAERGRRGACAHHAPARRRPRACLPAATSARLPSRERAHHCGRLDRQSSGMSRTSNEKEGAGGRWRLPPPLPHMVRRVPASALRASRIAQACVAEERGLS